jgi:hypothetical protein
VINVGRDINSKKYQYHKKTEEKDATFTTTETGL